MVIDDDSVLIHNDLSLSHVDSSGNPILNQNDTSSSASTNSIFHSDTSQDSSSDDMEPQY